MSESLHVIALAQTADVGDTDPPEMPVLYTGSFEHSGRKFDVTEADLDRAVENFNAQLAAGTEIPTDYEHGKAEGGIASGWYKALRREGNRLLAKIAWTDKAREQIKAGERKYFSPEFTSAAADEAGKALGFKLLAGALCVRPHLKSLGAVALTEEARAALAADFSENQVDALVRLAELLTASVSPTPKDRPDMSDTPVTAKEVQDLTVALAEVRDEVKTLRDENVKLSERADAADERADTAATELAEERLGATLAQARREGRIDAKDETTAEFAELAEKVGLDGIKTILAKIPAETIPMSEIGHGGSAPEATDAPEGVDPRSYKAAQLAEKFESEGMTADEAASKAYTEAYA